MENGDFGSIRQQIGEILGTARSLSDQMRESKEESRRQEDRLNTELRSTKEEHRANSQTISVRIEQLTGQIRMLDEKARTISTELTDVKQDVSRSRVEIAELRAPVNNLIQIRNRIMRYAMMVISAATVLWYIVGPILHGLLESTVMHFFKK